MGTTLDHEPDTAKFDLGEVVVTPEASAYLAEVGLTASTFLRLHAAGRWNEVFGWENNASLSRGESLFLRTWYHTPLGKHLWVITDAARTVVMLPLVCERCRGDLLWPTLDRNTSFCSQDCFEDQVRSTEGLGFLYFFEEIGPDRIQIGWTKNVDARLAEVRAVTSHGVMALKRVVGTRTDEHDLQVRFAALKVNPNWMQDAPPEWFHAAPELREYIDGIKVEEPWE